MTTARLLLGLILAAAAASWPAANELAIDRARAALEEAAGALDAARGGSARLAALGQAVAAHEAALAAYRETLRAMASREARLRAEMEEDGERLERLLVALQALGRAPRPALLGAPGGPVGAVRAASLIAAVSPVLDARTVELRSRLEIMARLRASQDAARIEARGVLAALQELRAETAEALREHGRALPAREKLRAQAEAAETGARSLHGLTASLRGAAAEAPDGRVSFSEARGLVPPPVPGVVTGFFGELDPWGRRGQGVTLSAPAFAQVTAPWDGTVRYAGPLIDYGNVVVLEPEAGTLIVLAGLASVDRMVGETVFAGERLGALGGPLPDSDEFLLATTTDRDAIRAESLYIELRRAGKPVDPALWFNLAMQGTDG